MSGQLICRPVACQQALGIPSDLEQATQRMADALSHAEARLVMQGAA